jgi:hypothetical protein
MHHLCKICNAFGSQPNILNSINLDIFSKLKTMKEVCAYYTPFLPSGFAPLSRVNLEAHKRHTDVSILLKPLLAQRKEYTSRDGEDVYTQLYEAGNQPIVDYLYVLDMMLRCRMKDLTNIERIVQRARKYCDDAVSEYDVLKAAGSNEEVLKLAIKVRGAENRLFELVERRQGLWNELQSDVLNITGNTMEKEKMVLRFEIMKGLHRTFNDMLLALSNYIIKEAFTSDMHKGRAVYSKILEIMDDIVTPALEPLDESKKVISKQKRLTA